MNRRGFLAGLLASACVAVSGPLVAQRNSRPEWRELTTADLISGRMGRYEGVTIVEGAEWDASSLNRADQLRRNEYHFIVPSDRIADAIHDEIGTRPEVMEQIYTQTVPEFSTDGMRVWSSPRGNSAVHKAYQEHLNKVWRDYVGSIPEISKHYATHGRAMWRTGPWKRP